MRVFVTGGTGLVGRRLVPALSNAGHEVVVLTRSAAKAHAAFGDDALVVQGDPMQPGAWQARIDGCDAVVNLVGESAFGHRWDGRFKQLLRDSRILSTRHVVEAIEASTARPKVLINASAVGYYGFRDDAELDESAAPGNDFLALLAIDWEREADAAAALGTRVVKLRTGIVLDPTGGALHQMLPAFRMFAGGHVGSGEQFVSWVHYEDEVRLILFALANASSSGALNATAPEAVTNRQFAKTLGKALHRPSFLGVPRKALDLAFGEGADVLVEGQRVVPTKALAAGFAFRFPTLREALGDLLSVKTTAPLARARPKANEPPESPRSRHRNADY